MVSAAFETTPDGQGPEAAETPDGVSEDRVFGDYEILDEIAHGGMGVVYRARQRELGREVALKLLLLGRFASEVSIQRFRREAQMAAALRHPNIVTVHEVGEVEGQHYFSMELIEGPTLEQRLRDGPLAPRVAATYLRKVAAAMHHAHAAGLLHRDLKPSNILIDPFDEPRVADFGLARRLDEAGRLTETAQILGTPNYMAPELTTEGKDSADARADLFSLGAILYQALTGLPPFFAASVPETLSRIRSTEPVSPRLLVAKLPQDLETICLKCLEKEPSRRYASTQQFAEELDRFLAGVPIVARRATLPERCWKWCRRNPAPAMALLSVVSVLLVASIFSGWMALGERRARERETRARLEAEHSAYAADISAAWQAWTVGDMGRMRNALQTYDDSPMTGFEWRLLRRLANGDHDAVLLERPLVPWNAFARSPDGELFAASSPSNLVVVEFKTGRVIHSKTLPRAHRRGLAFLSRSSSIAVTSGSGCIVHDLEKGTERILPVGGCDTLAPSPDGLRLASCSSYHPMETNVTVWNLAGDFLETTLSGVASPTMRWDPSSKDLRMVTFDGRLASWSVGQTSAPSSRPLPRPDNQANPFSTLSDDGQVLAYYDIRAGALVIVRLDSSRETVIRANQRLSAAVSLSPDGRILAAGTELGSILLFSTETGRELGLLRGHDQAPGFLRFVGPTQIVSGSSDGSIRLWSFKEPLLEKAPKAPSENEPEAGLSPGPPLPPFEVPFANSEPMMEMLLSKAAFSPDGHWFAVTGFAYDEERGPRTFLYDCMTRASPRTIRGKMLGFSPAGDGLLVLDQGVLEAVGVDGQKAPVPFPAPDVFMSNEVALSANGRYLAVELRPQADPTNQVWSSIEVLAAATGRPLGRAKALQGFWVLEDEGTILTLEADDRPMRVDPRSGAAVPSDTGPLYPPKRSRAGQWRVVVDEGNSSVRIRFVDDSRGTVGGAVELTAALVSFDVSPDAKTLATVDYQNSLSLRQIPSGKEFMTLRLPDRVEDIAFSPDGKTLMVLQPRRILALEGSSPSGVPVEQAKNSMGGTRTDVRDTIWEHWPLSRTRP